MREVRLPRLLLFWVARRPVSALFLMSLAGLVWNLGPGTPERSGAARYQVVQCGWKVGNEGRWIDTSSGRFNSSTWCAVPPKSDPWEGIHVTSGTRTSTKLVRGTDMAKWRWRAPVGTGMVAVSGGRWHVLKDGFRHRLGSVALSGGFTPFAEFTSTDTVRRDFSRHFPSQVSAFESRLVCAKAQGANCNVSGTSLAGVRALNFILDDPSRPTAEAEGPFGESEWVNGKHEIVVASKDSGSGIQSQEFLVDESAVIRADAGCARTMIAGHWRGTRMKPCEVTARLTRSLSTERFSDGPHTVRACAQDFAGNRGCTNDRKLLTDNTAPAPPRSLEVIGGEQWRPSNGFSLAWQIPDQGKAAPVTGARYVVTGPNGFSLGPLDTDAPDSLSDLQLPTPGEFRIEVWLVDAAGNEDRTAFSPATLRLDDVPPNVHLLRPAADRPDSIRAPLSDEHSGPEGGLIQVRSSGSGAWEDLATTFDPERGWLVASLDSESRLPGTWEVRATGVDRAGNQTSTTSLQDGSPLLIQTPAKGETDLQARLTSGRRSGGQVTVRLGQRSQLTGRLVRWRGRGLASQRVRIIEVPDLSSRATPLVRSALTDGSGRFRIGLGPGVSRRVSVYFTGNDRLGRSSAGPLHLRVTAGLGFRAKPRRLATGERIRFSGRIFPGRATRAARGSLIQIQYLEAASGRWRPVLVTRIGRGGRYGASYRFRYVTSTARIRMRAVLIPGRSFPYARTESAVRSIRVSGG